MKISYIEPIPKNNKRVERIFGCSYANYPFPNLYVLIIFALMEKKHEVCYNQEFLNLLDEKSIKRFLDRDRSDIYLIFSVNLSMDTDIAFARKVHKITKDKTIIFLGPAPTLFADKFVIDSNTYIVRGEPDFTTIALIDALVKRGSLENIDGISYLKDAKIVHNKSRDIIDNLDQLPFPARHFIKKDEFFNPKLGLKPFTAMLTSRGCSHRCIYCVPCALNFARELEFKKLHANKPPVRLRSASNVIKEFKFLKDAEYKTVSIIDDQFIWDKRRALEICQGIKNLGISWGCLSRSDHLDEEIVMAMCEAGCRYVDIGVESFVQKILDYTKKDVSVEKMVEGIKLLKKHKIFTKINILFGSSPYETIDTINYTMGKIREIRPDQVMFDVCSPFPGTEFYKIAKLNNWIAGNDYTPIDVAHSAHINYPHLSSKELERVVYGANLRFFLNPKFMVSNLLRLKRPGSIMEAAKAALRKINIWV